MNYHDQMILALANLLACAGLFSVCAARIAVMSKHTTRIAWRVNYSVLMAASVGSGFSPLFFNQWPGVATVFLTLAFLAILLTSRTWGDGVPWYARRNQLDRRSST